MVERSYLLKILMLIIYQQCWKFFMCLIFVGEGYPRKLFNLEHFPIYGMLFYNSEGYIGTKESGLNLPADLQWR